MLSSGAGYEDFGDFQVILKHRKGSEAQGGKHKVRREKDGSSTVRLFGTFR